MQNPPLLMQRATLAEQIETHIRELIVSDKLGPGEVLPSSIDLATEFGVSRSIVREAMKSLQAKGLIEISNGKRARVQPITNTVLVDFFDRFAQPHKAAVIELLELRKGIEVQGAVLAAQRRTGEDLERIWSFVRQMETKIGDPDAFLDIDVELHLAIVAASKNRMLFHLVDSIREVMRDTMKEGLVRHTASADWHRIHASHVTLVTFVDQQDAAGAGACMATHFDEAIHGILTREPLPLPAPVGTAEVGRQP
jgi:GntR family transcriptional repressor for pyruvate dehydrogenase complex